MKHINAWTTYSEEETKKVMDFAERYRRFISKNKIEREFCAASIQMAKDNGFECLEEFIKAGKKLKAGDKIYSSIQDKSVILLQIGKRPLSEVGMNILGAHIDSPRFDIKQNPLFQDGGITLLDTHYYGGIYMYQWVNIPMALHGVVCKKDGQSVHINIGDKPGDPVLFFSDLLIHLSHKNADKPMSKFINAEKVDLLVGSRPLVDGVDVDKNKDQSDAFDVSSAAEANSCVSEAGNQAIKAYIMKLLNESYEITEDDFYSAELEVVPAGEARDCGFDRSMLVGYGHDDSACAYPSLIALFDAVELERTSCCILTDKEEIGSSGATSMMSKFFENSIAEIMELTGEPGMLNCRRALQKSNMLSSDVSAAYDPSFKEMFELKNSCYLGDGLVVNKYGGSRGKVHGNDSSPEYLATLRKLFDDNNVIHQSAELGAVDVGGGGTIAYITANFGMNVVDSGVAVLSMHCPWEVVSKADLYEAYKGYKAFLECC